MASNKDSDWGQGDMMIILRLYLILEVSNGLCQDGGARVMHARFRMILGCMRLLE